MKYPIHFNFQTSRRNRTRFILSTRIIRKPKKYLNKCFFQNTNSQARMKSEYRGGKNYVWAWSVPRTTAGRLQEWGQTGETKAASLSWTQSKEEHFQGRMKREAWVSSWDIQLTTYPWCACKNYLRLKSHLNDLERTTLLPFCSAVARTSKTR